MKVIVAETAGFCRGVKRAVDLARRLAVRGTGPVQTDGPLIHNEQVMAALRAEGIRETERPERLRGGTLVIRAHGISPERRKLLRAAPVELADATCPDVARSQGLIRRHARKGFHTIIFGDPGHAEVVGLLGYAEGRGHVVASECDVDRLPDLDSVCLCSQSTQFPEDYAWIAAAVRRRYPGVVVLDTICAATRNRQEELVRMANEVDLFVVVGSRHSANTQRLVELARRLRPTVHIQTPDQLEPNSFQACRTVGLTAGASTPDDIIEAVRAALEKMPGANAGVTSG